MSLRARLARAVAVVTLAWLVLPAWPATMADGETRPLEAAGLRRLYADPQPSSFHVPPPEEHFLRPKRVTITINYLPAGPGRFGDSCIEWPAGPKAAFSYAAGIWGALLTSAVPIAIDACWADNLESNVLGHAGSLGHYRDFSGAPARNVWYPSALANALRGSRLDTAQADIYAAFNRDFNWYLGTDGRTPSTQQDFASVVLHEIGHGLGFSGSMDVQGGQGSWGLGSGLPFAYDRFTENALGQSLISTSSFANPSVALATQLQSNNLFFDGTNANAANGGARVPLYAPAAWNGGSSYSHLAESYNNTPNALMTFALASGESLHSPGPVTLGILRDIGWPAIAAEYLLTVTRSGAGTGTVDSSPGGISCGSVCSASYAAGAAVTLTATSASGSRFSGWSGACTGTGTCALTINGATSATAAFVRTATLTVSKAGTGTGTVSSAPAGIGCGSTCTATYDLGTAVTLTATPAAGATFTGWSGACSGSGLCTVTLNAATSVTATFTTPPPAVVTITKAGTGAGLVTSAPAGISCGATCSASFVAGTALTLSATPLPGSSFTGWSGACSGTGACTIGAVATASVTATFQAVQGGALAASTAAIDFGAQSIMTTSPGRTFTLSNSGTAALSLSSITASAHFGVVHNCASLAPGASCNVFATFTPLAQGPLAGTLTIASSLGAAAIPLSGVGERSLVTHYYLSILRRAPDSGGKPYWEGEATRIQGLGANVNEAWFAMAQSFFASAEYVAQNRGNAQLVADVYNTFFNRPPDEAGLSFWQSQLAGGLPREVLIASFMFSPEFASFTSGIFGSAQVRPEIDLVVDLYRGILARLPDSIGFNFWLGQIRIAQCTGSQAVLQVVEAMSSSFASGAEYAARNRGNAAYVGDLYNAFLRRGADLDGVLFWISQLDRGARSRDQVRRDFMASPEFTARVSAITAQSCAR